MFGNADGMLQEDVNVDLTNQKSQDSTNTIIPQSPNTFFFPDPLV